MNSEYFCKLLSIDPQKLPADEAKFYAQQRLGKRPEDYGFTKEERDFIDRVHEAFPEAIEQPDEQ